MSAIITSMQLSPIYDRPILVIEGLGDPTPAVARQSERFVATLRGLSDEQWAAQSRCELWSVKDVASHLGATNAFWQLSFEAGTKGEPTRFLATFDPVTTPEQLVDATRATSAREVLAKFEQGVAGLLASLRAAQDWSVLAEAPPGHLALNAAALHALWDSWVHERDVAIPLGLPIVEDAEEMRLILQYAAALSPAFFAAKGTGKHGAFIVEATEPALAFTVDIGDQVVVRPGAVGDGPRLRGRAVDLIEGLSHRAPLAHDLPAEDQWLLVGLAEVFDVA